MEFTLPVDTSFTRSGVPGGIRQQFSAARDLVEATLVRLKRVEGLQVGF